MAVDLEHFGIGEQLRCSSIVRGAGQGHATMEAAARAVCRCLYEELVMTTPSGLARACALVRCYKTHPYSGLPDELQRFARTMLPTGEPPRPALRCLTLLASAGDEPAWNSRHESRGHKAIPLPSPDFVAKAPMIAALVRDFGLEPADVVTPNASVMRDRKGKNYGVFHVERAAGSPVIPAQAEFVRPRRIESAVGFGGSLDTGDLFAVILFSRARIGPEVAERFRAFALNVKTAFFGFDEDQVFELSAPVAGDAPASTATL